MRFRLHELRSLVSEAIRKAYEILGVSPSATPEEIKKAYRAKAMALHPDRNAGRDTSADIVKVNVAYGLLSDPAKRSTYDRAGDKTLGDAGSAGAGGGPVKQDYDWWADIARAKKARDEQARRKQTDPRGPGWAYNSPRPSPRAKAPTRRYFTYAFDKSRKFWWVERTGRHVVVGWGKLGTPGQQKVHNFDTDIQAAKFVIRMIDSKLGKGYRESTSPSSQQAAPPPAPTAKKPEPKAPPPTAARPSSKTTYKVYGKRGNAPAHTRYQGQVYVAASGTKFHGGDKATVALGTDGRLSIHNPDTGHTQHWTREAFEVFLDDVLIETLLT